MIKLKELLHDIDLCEGLMRSVSPESLQNHLNRWTISKGKFTSKIIDDKIHLTITDNLNEKDIKNLLMWINNLGWFVDSFLFVKINPTWEKFDEKNFVEKYSNNTIGIFLELKAKYDKEHTHIEITNDFYHVTPTKHESKILKMGLVPKAKHKIGTHPDRIYLTKRIVDASALADIFSNIDNENQYTIFKVDVTSAKERNENLKLFNDPDLSGGLYTLSNIPPQFLKIVKRINV